MDQSVARESWSSPKEKHIQGVFHLKDPTSPSPAYRYTVRKKYQLEVP